MHPIERLRYVARSYGADPAEVAAEAADALADLAFEPRALVLACRRLLDAQPRNGPLWWVAAHVVAAADPGAAARACARRLGSDLTGLELAYALPAGAVLVAAAASSVLAALGERPDVELRLVGEPLELRYRLAELADGVAGGPRGVGYGPDELEEGLEGAALALVEAEAASPTRVLLRPAAAALARAAAGAGAALWVAAGAGRVLPDPLFERCAEGASDDVVEAGLAVKVVGPAGLVGPVAGFDPGDCPSPATLTAGSRRR